MEVGNRLSLNRLDRQAYAHRSRNLGLSNTSEKIGKRKFFFRTDFNASLGVS
jgi:hypothetical protein